MGFLDDAEKMLNKTDSGTCRYRKIPLLILLTRYDHFFTNFGMLILLPAGTLSGFLMILALCSAM